MSVCKIQRPTLLVCLLVTYASPLPFLHSCRRRNHHHHYHASRYTDSSLRPGEGGCGSQYRTQKSCYYSQRTTISSMSIPLTLFSRSNTASSTGTSTTIIEGSSTNHTILDGDHENRMIIALEDSQMFQSSFFLTSSTAASASVSVVSSTPASLSSTSSLPLINTSPSSGAITLSLSLPSYTNTEMKTNMVEQSIVISQNPDTVTTFNTKHVMNSILLLVCFAFASYTIFNVDAGMTRGWTLEEKAMRIPLDNWASYESSLNTQPVITKTMINVIIYLLGDWASQTIFVKKNIIDFDAVRTLRNGFIGLCFGPLVHLYYEFSDTILPVEVGINRLYKICMDQTIYLAVKCSIYIMAVNVLSGESLETGQRKVQDKLQGIMFTAWKFWPLVHVITYNVIPARHRILWVNCVDLVWNAILSLRTNSNTTTVDEKTKIMEQDKYEMDNDTANIIKNGEEEGDYQRAIDDDYRKSSIKT